MREKGQTMRNGHGWNGVMGTRADVPALLLLLLEQFDAHHPPCQILHALLVGELGLCLAVELPHLGREGIVPLHGFRSLQISAGSIVLEIGEDGVRQEFLADDGGIWSQIQLGCLNVAGSVGRPVEMMEEGGGILDRRSEARDGCGEVERLTKNNDDAATAEESLDAADAAFAAEGRIGEGWMGVSE